MGKIRLNQFAGMNNHLEPHLLESPVAALLVDADTSRGNIRPFPRGKVVEAPSDERLDYESATRSLVNWNGRYFWSDNDTGELGSSLGYLGIDPPQRKPIVTPRAEGTLFTGNYQYLITFQARDGRESSPVRPGFPIDFAIAYVRTKRTITVPAASEIAAFDVAHVLHPTYGVGYRNGTVVTYNGHMWESIGTGPNGDKTGWLASLENGDWNRWSPSTILQHQWPGNDGGKFWKDLGETATTIEITGYDELLLEDIPQPVESHVDQINLYRTTADGADFFLAASLSVGTTRYLDRTPDSAIVTASRLETTDNGLPPVYVAGENGGIERLGGKYLTELVGTFFLVHDDRLYISAQSDPHSWNPLQYQSFEETITALGKDDSGILVFSANRMWRVTGTTFVDMTVKEIPEKQGCPNWRTLATMRNQVMWQSNDGICAFSPFAGRDGRHVRILTENIYDLDGIANFATVANEVYWLFQDQFAVCLDLGSGQIYERNVVADSAYYDVEGDTLYLIFSRQFTDTGAGEPAEWTRESAALFGDASKLKRFRRIWINSSGHVDVIAVVDGERARASFSVKKNGSAFFPAGLTGRSLQLVLTSRHEVSGLTIDYEVLG